MTLIATYGPIFFILVALIWTGKKEGWRERERQILQQHGIVAFYWEAQKKWHTAGFWQRLWMVCAIVIAVIPQWYLMLLLFAVGLWFAWVLYDGLTNMPKDLSTIPGTKRWYQKFFYSGTTQTGSKIDRMFGEYLPFIKLFYTILIPVLITIYLCLEVFT